MEIDDKENPNPNAIISAPETLVQTEPTEPPFPLIPTAIVPPIAPIRVLPPPPLPSLRPQNGNAAKTTNKDDEEDDEYEISEESRLFREKQEKAKDDFLMKQRAAALAVPTNDKAVRSRLRRLGEPTTLFGEKEMERRDRLRMIMAKLERVMQVLEEEDAAVNAVGMEEGKTIQYPFYTEGSMALLKARYEIAKDSMVKAAMRRKRRYPDEDLDAEINWALENAKTFSLDCSEIGDDRPLSGCSFSYDGKFLATWGCFFFSFSIKS